MAAAHLVFDQQRHATGNPVPLVFGAGGGASVPRYALFAQGRITGLRGQVRMASVLQLQAKGRITGLRGTVAVGWNVNVSRPSVAQITDAAQQAQTLRTAVQAEWQQAQRTQNAVAQIWQDAQHVSAQVRALWQQAQPLYGMVQDAMQDATPVRATVISSYQQALRRHAAVRDAMQDALALRACTLVGFEEALRLRGALQSRMQQGVPTAGHWLTSFSHGLPLRIGGQGRFQEATKPGPGLWVRPQPPKPQPCYVPGLPAKLLFTETAAFNLPAALVFRCGHTTEEPGESVVVPLRKVYIVQNSVTLVRMDGGQELQAFGFNMSLDQNSWTWTWSATLNEDAGAFLEREANGDPARVLVTINGIDFQLRMERKRQDKRFLPQVRWHVSGRGRNSILGSSTWAPNQQFGNPTTAWTAQQLMLDALTVNGVSLGWSVDWQLQDWDVPAGAWSLHGSYMDAVLDIAGAAGGYVQPHHTDQTLKVLHKYPVAPWHWADVTPKFVLPADVSEVDAAEFLDKPAYNRVFVGGVGAGVFGPWTRAGTAGEILAPEVTHALITDISAQRQRAIAELGDTGQQTLRTISLPVLPETGIIVPGDFIRYDGQIGLVRSTDVNWNFPVLRQSLEVETHA